MRNFLIILSIAFLSGCATVAPSLKASDKVVSGHTIYFTVLEDCPEPAKPELCQFSAIEIVDDLGIVDNMTLNGFSKIGIKETEQLGIWQFVRSTAEADRTIDLSTVKPLRRIQSLEK